jgi:hypothetical protein
MSSSLRIRLDLPLCLSPTNTNILVYSRLSGIRVNTYLIPKHPLVSSWILICSTDYLDTLPHIAEDWSEIREFVYGLISSTVSFIVVSVTII